MFNIQIYNFLGFDVQKDYSDSISSIVIYFFNNFGVPITNLSQMKHKSFTLWFKIILLANGNNLAVDESFLVFFFLVFVPVGFYRIKIMMAEDNWRSKIWVILSIMLCYIRHFSCEFSNCCFTIFYEAKSYKFIFYFVFFIDILYFEIVNVLAVLDPSVWERCPAKKMHVAELYLVNKFKFLSQRLELMNLNSLDFALLDISSDDGIVVTFDT